MEENYLENIRSYIISEQARTIVRDYNANKSKLETYYKIGKELAEAGKHYGEGIIKKYSVDLKNEFGKSYGFTNLNYMRQFYNFVLTFPNFQPVVGNLTWTHILILLPLKNLDEIKFYINLAIRDNLSKRALADRIKLNEYGRLTPETKLKLKEEKEINQSEMVPSTIVIPSDKLKKELTEKVLEELVIKNISVVMKQLGEGYSFIESQYKINVGNKKNYIDLLLFNIKFNNYVVIELKAREFRKEDIGQIKLYMNYIDKEVKNITQNKTMGIIITKSVNKFEAYYVKDNQVTIVEFKINKVVEVS